jgi:hypothetical protein
MGNVVDSFKKLPSQVPAVEGFIFPPRGTFVMSHGYYDPDPAQSILS